MQKVIIVVPRQGIIPASLPRCEKGLEETPKPFLIIAAKQAII